MLRDEMEFGEVVRWISLHPLKQKQRYKRLALSNCSLIYLHNKWLNYTLNQLKHYIHESETSVKTLYNPHLLAIKLAT